MSGIAWDFYAAHGHRLPPDLRLCARLWAEATSGRPLSLLFGRKDAERLGAAIKDLRAACARERVCALCGSPFQPRKGRMFCSKACGRNWHHLIDHLRIAFDDRLRRERSRIQSAHPAHRDRRDLALSRVQPGEPCWLVPRGFRRDAKTPFGLSPAVMVGWNSMVARHDPRIPKHRGCVVILLRTGLTTVGNVKVVAAPRDRRAEHRRITGWDDAWRVPDDLRAIVDHGLRRNASSGLKLDSTRKPVARSGRAA